MYTSKDKFAFHAFGAPGLRARPRPVPEPVPGPVPGSVSVPGFLCFGLSIFALGLETKSKS